MGKVGGGGWGGSARSRIKLIAFFSLASSSFFFPCVQATSYLLRAMVKTSYVEDREMRYVSKGTARCRQ